MNRGDHTTWTSTAGSPAQADPQSTMPRNRPSSTRQLPSRSPWTQTGGPRCSGAARASSQISSAVEALIKWPARRTIDRVTSSYSANGRARFVAGGASLVGTVLQHPDCLGEVQCEPDGVIHSFH